jgi:hypothetical protein
MGDRAPAAVRVSKLSGAGGCCYGPAASGIRLELYKHGDKHGARADACAGNGRPLRRGEGRVESGGYGGLVRW